MAALSLLVACSSSSTNDGHASAIDACSLLSTDEILQTTGLAMGPGLLQTTDIQASCDWNPVDTTLASGAGVLVQDFDPTLWDNVSSSPLAIPVTGIGEKAFKRFPHVGDLSVKQGPYEVDVAIIDFNHATDAATLDAESLALMQLVLPRI